VCPLLSDTVCFCLFILLFLLPLLMNDWLVKMNIIGSDTWPIESSDFWWPWGLSDLQSYSFSRLFTYCKLFQMRVLVHMCWSWQDFKKRVARYLCDSYASCKSVIRYLMWCNASQCHGQQNIADDDEFVSFAKWDLTLAKLFATSLLWKSVVVEK